MIWEWYGVIGAGVLIVVFTYLGIVFSEFGMWPGSLVFLNGVALLLVISFLVTSLIGTIGPPISKNRCNKFGSNGGFTVKFIKYNTLSWECLVKVNGRWVPKSNLQNVIINNGK